jgi:hypothetical protein
MKCYSFIVFITSILFSWITNAQNLVQNPGFEDNTGCPGPFVFLNNTKFWSGVENHNGTPDLFWKDFGYNGIGKRNSMAMDQLPKDGEGFIGMFCCGDNLREYATTQLKEPMIAGKNYTIEFWVRPAVGYGTAINSFGAHFSTSPIVGNGGLAPLQLEEHVGNSKDRTLSDTSNWTLISGSYTAMRGESFMTLGNFKTDNETVKQIIKVNCIRSDRSYLLLDQVSVRLSEDTEQLLVKDTSAIKKIQRVTKDVYHTQTKDISLQYWDHNIEDGDSITILLNDEIIAENLAIKKQIQTLTLALDEGDNFIDVHALNLGVKPPNTVAIRLSDGKTEKKIIISSNLTVSQAIKIVYKL